MSRLQREAGKIFLSSLTYDTTFPFWSPSFLEAWFTTGPCPIFHWRVNWVSELAIQFLTGTRTLTSWLDSLNPRPYPHIFSTRLPGPARFFFSRTLSWQGQSDFFYACHLLQPHLQNQLPCVCVLGWGEGVVGRGGGGGYKVKLQPQFL